jgi:Complex I intermediate-associated protein 30 (CIA30)
VGRRLCAFFFFCFATFSFLFRFWHPVDWEGLRIYQIPFDGFVMTKAGTINTQPVLMLRERVRSVGISLLGGNSGVEGPYELGIDEIRAVNEEDVTVMPRKLAISFQVEGVTKGTWPSVENSMRGPI